MATVRAGTDMNLGDVYNATLRESLAAGLIDKAAIDLAMRRVLLSRFKVGEFDVRPSVNPYLTVPHSVANSPAHIELAYEAALQGMVLLSNDGSVLPLSVSGLRKGIAVVGPNANDSSIMLGNCASPQRPLATFAEYTQLSDGSFVFAQTTAEPRTSSRLWTASAHCSARAVCPSATHRVAVACGVRTTRGLQQRWQRRLPLTLSLLVSGSAPTLPRAK